MGKGLGVMTLVLLLGCACVLGPALVTGLMIMGGRVDANPGFEAAALAGATWVVSMAFGLVLMLVIARGDALRLGPAVLASSTARMLAAFAVGLVAYFAAKPDGMTFWMSFLAAGLLCLAAETTWAVKTISCRASAAARA